MERLNRRRAERRLAPDWSPDVVELYATPVELKEVLVAIDLRLKALPAFSPVAPALQRARAFFGFAQAQHDVRIDQAKQAERGRDSHPVYGPHVEELHHAWEWRELERDGCIGGAC